MIFLIYFWGALHSFFGLHSSRSQVFQASFFGQVVHETFPFCRQFCHIQSTLVRLSYNKLEYFPKRKRDNLYKQDKNNNHILKSFFQAGSA